MALAKDKQVKKGRTTSLARRLREQYKPCPRVDAELPPLAVIRLQQTRQDFDGIEELAMNIAGEGLLQRTHVAAFTVKGSRFREYLETINTLRGTSYEEGEFLDRQFLYERKLIYPVLIDGERRTRGEDVLHTTGCEECRAAGRVLSDGCYRNHPAVASGLMPVVLYSDPHPFEALDKQFYANTYVPLPPEVEAKEYYGYWKLNRAVDQNLTMAEFARRVNRSVGKISNAIRYAELPSSVLWYVDQKHISYTMALELSRIQRYWVEAKKEVDAEFLERLVTTAITNKWKVDDMKKRVQVQLSEWQYGQGTLEDMFNQSAVENERKLARKLTVEKEILYDIQISTRYVERMLVLFDEGKLGPEDAPFSVGGPINQVRSLVGKLRKALGRLRSHNCIKQAEYDKSMHTVDRFEKEAEKAVGS